MLSAWFHLEESFIDTNFKMNVRLSWFAVVFCARAALAREAVMLQH
jgi:hypothetical protein